MRKPNSSYEIATRNHENPPRARRSASVGAADVRWAEVGICYVCDGCATGWW